MINEYNQKTIEILSEMRSEYNCFGSPDEVSRYHALSEAIKAVAERDYSLRVEIAKHALDEAKRLYGESNIEAKPGSLLNALYDELDDTNS